MERKDAATQRFGAGEPDAQLNRLASAVIDAAVEVHRILGPGFIQSVYERSLCLELALRGTPHQRQVRVGVQYKGCPVGEGCVDLLVGERLLVELKATATIDPVHLVQVRSYLRATSLQLGLLINFNVPLLHRGVRRIVLTQRLDGTEQ